MYDFISGEVKEVVVTTVNKESELSDPNGAVTLEVFTPDGERTEYIMSRVDTGVYSANVDFTSDASGEGYLVVETVSVPFVDKMKVTFTLENLHD